MANGTRTLTFLVVFAVSIAGSWIIGCSRPESESFQPAPGNHLMKVGPAAANVGTAIQKNHKMFWKARVPGKTLQIRFKAADFPAEAMKEPPFQGGTKDTDQIIECKSNGVCDSGAVNRNVIPLIPANGLYYKYYQVLIDDVTKVSDEADAGIIIER